VDAQVKKIVNSYKKERGTAPPYIEMLAMRKPEVLKSWISTRKQIIEKGVIPRKYKELMIMLMCFARLYPGGSAHIKAAMKYGATQEEIFEAMMLAIPGVGIPPFSTAVNALKAIEGK
jgi:alkylhydroperoxidase/carboxymuconolactone decarboxylase family protein YurZ